MMRDSVDHPNEKRTLHTSNFDVRNIDGKLELVEPMWWTMGTEKEQVASNPIASGMDAIIESCLKLNENVLIEIFMKLTKLPLVLEEIDHSRRDPVFPQRFRVALHPEELKRIGIEFR